MLAALGLVFALAAAAFPPAGDAQTRDRATERFEPGASAFGEQDGPRAELMQRSRSAFRRPRYARFPDHAPYDRRVALLGKMLFFDPRLSGAGSISCASCHSPSFGWELPARVAPGGAPLERQPPTLLNVAWGESFSWDGRAPSLEAQAVFPIESPTGMAADLDQVVARLNGVASYARWFREAFPEEGLTRETALTALATFERTIVSGWAPFDSWVEGEETALSPSARRGFELFTGEAGCDRCHEGWNFTDGAFHDVGLVSPDPGRAAIAGGEDGAKRFKTPTLRDIAKRAPYMHDGSLPDLGAVLDHYASLGKDTTVDLQPVDLDADQRRDLIAFLHSLSGEGDQVAAPTLPAD